MSIYSELKCLVLSACCFSRSAATWASLWLGRDTSWYDWAISSGAWIACAHWRVCSCKTACAASRRLFLRSRSPAVVKGSRPCEHFLSLSLNSFPNISICLTVIAHFNWKQTKSSAPHQIPRRSSSVWSFMFGISCCKLISANVTEPVLIRFGSFTSPWPTEADRCNKFRLGGIVVILLIFILLFDWLIEQKLIEIFKCNDLCLSSQMFLWSPVLHNPKIQLSFIKNRWSSSGKQWCQVRNGLYSVFCSSYCNKLRLPDIDVAGSHP